MLSFSKILSNYGVHFSDTFAKVGLHGVLCYKSNAHLSRKIDGTDG